MIDIAKGEILDHLERIASSRTFSSCPRLVEMLRFCVETSIWGDIDHLKETTIAVSVFGRSPDYDPKIDAIVRVQARRLRDKLEDFYKTEGVKEPLVIEIRKGCYVPHFERRVQEAPVCEHSVDGLLVQEVAREELPSGVPLYAASTSIAHVPANRQTRIQWQTVFFTAVATLAIACCAYWAASKARELEQARSNVASPHGSATSIIFPLTALPGSQRDPAWSPDGSMVAFAWTKSPDERARIYMSRVDSDAPVALTNGAQPEYRPVWSPDGQSLAFVRQAGRFDFQVVLLNLKSRVERVLHTQSFESPLPLEVPALDWSRDGKWIVSSEQHASSPVHLILISLRDGHANQITDPPNASTGDLEARFSPDGRELAFRRGGVGDIWLVSLNDERASNPRPLTQDNPGVRGLCWSADGRAIFFGSHRGATQYSIWRLPVDGSSPTQVTPTGVEAISPALGAGGRLAFVRPTVFVNIWRYDLAALLPPKALSGTTRAEFSPAFSHDGRKLAFISDRTGPAEVWVSAADGSQARKVTSLGGSGLPFMPSWSPDGTTIVFFCRRDGRNYVIEVPVNSGQERVLEGGESYALEPQYSADGKYLYYISNKGGRFRIWRKSVDGSAGAAEVTSEEAEFFRLSRDGHSLYFVRQGSPAQLIQMNLLTAEQHVVWTWKNPMSLLGSWDVSGNHLYYVAQLTGRPNSQLVHADLETKQEKVLGSIKTTGWQAGIAESIDGRSVLVSQVDRDETDVMYVNIDPSESRKR